VLQHFAKNIYWSTWSSCMSFNMCIHEIIIKTKKSVFGFAQQLWIQFGKSSQFLIHLGGGGRWCLMIIFAKIVSIFGTCTLLQEVFKKFNNYSDVERFFFFLNILIESVLEWKRNFFFLGGGGVWYISRLLNSPSMTRCVDNVVHTVTKLRIWVLASYFTL
jgi:hypothetical protein